MLMLAIGAGWDTFVIDMSTKSMWNENIVTIYFSLYMAFTSLFLLNTLTAVITGIVINSEGVPPHESRSFVFRVVKQGFNGVFFPIVRMIPSDVQQQIREGNISTIDQIRVFRKAYHVWRNTFTAGFRKVITPISPDEDDDSGKKDVADNLVAEYVTSDNATKVDAFELEEMQREDEANQLGASTIQMKLEHITIMLVQITQRLEKLEKQDLE
jgi:hypothetical protein